MKILLVGVFSFGSTDNWKLLALRRLGHMVVCCPYRDRSVSEWFAIGEPFDLVFVSKGVPLDAGDLAHLATLGRARLLWWPDPFENWNEHLTTALRTGLWRVSATSSVVLAKILDAAGCGCCGGDGPLVESARILEGCDCEGPRPEWAPEHVEPALLHFGHLSERRTAVIERLRASGVRVDVVERPLYDAQLQLEVLRHAAVLGINSSPDLYSNRVQTVLAMGGAIAQEDAPGLWDDFDSLAALWPWSERESVDDVLLEACRTAIEHGPACRGHGATRVYDQFKWERVMERAVEFACGGGA